MKKITALAMAGILMASGCALQSQGPAAAVVGGHKVTQSEIEFYSDNYRFGSNEAESAVTQAINSRIVIELCDKMGIETDDEDEASIKSTIITLRKAHGGTTEFGKYIKGMGLDEDFIKEALAADLLKEKLLEQLDIQASDEEIKEYFNNSYYKAKHILIMTGDDEAASKEKAEGILARVNAGEDFDTLMNEFTEDPGSKSNPDGYTFTDGEMVTEFEDTVKGLAIGGVGMCKSSFGYHIIKRLELDDAGMESVKETITSKLKNDKFITEIRNKAEENKIKIEENDDKKSEIIEYIKQDLQTQQSTAE